MKHPILMVVLLALSIFHVTRRFLLTSSDASSLQIERMQQNRQKKSTFVVVVDVADGLHRAIPRDLDHPVVIPDRPQSPLLTTRRNDAGGSGISVGDEADEKTREKRVAKHAPYALWAHGHLLFLHHKQHGELGIDALVNGFESRSIAVDGVILDAHWWHPASYFVPHPQLYPNGFQRVGTQPPGSGSAIDGGHRLSFGGLSGPHIVLWMSALIPTSTSQYREGRQKAYFVHRGAGDDPHMFAWPRKDGPSLHGALLDFTNPMAVQWFGAALVELLQKNPAVSGFRCAGVDALLGGIKNLFGAGGHIDDRLYRDLYYRFFLDIGRSVRGISFLVVGRAVDSFGSYQYQQFAPRESLFAGWVGDHPFTFSGMRESAMNVVHSAYQCYVNVGSMIGGSFVDVPQTRKAFEAWQSGMELADSGTAASHRTYRQQERRYMEAEAFPTSGVSTSDSSSGCSEKDLMRIRTRELFERWLQWSATMPFLSNGGSETGSPWAYAPGTTTLYTRLVREHRALALYYATAAVDSLDHFFDTEFHYQNVPFRKTKLRADPRADHCPLVPLSSETISFMSPNSPLRWAMRVGSDLVVVPIFDSFGRTIRDDVLTLTAADIDMKQLHGSRLSDWVLLGRPRTTALSRSGHAVPIPIPSSTDAPLILRRRDSIIPILQAIGSASTANRTQKDNAVPSSSSSRSGDSMDDDVDDGDAPQLHRCLSTTVVLTVDRPPVGLLLGQSTPTAVVDRNEMVPAMDVSLMLFNDSVATRGGSNGVLEYSVAFMDDGAGGVASHVDAEASTTEGNNVEEDGDSEGGATVWDPSLQIVTVLSMFEGLSNQNQPPLSVRCNCHFVDLDGAERLVACSNSNVVESRVGALGGSENDSGSLLHERHYANTTAYFSPADAEDGGMEPANCHHARSVIVPSTWQLFVLSPMQGEFRCQCLRS